MSTLTLDVGEWAQENFGGCELGDVRRTRRAVTVARQMAEHPDGSTPDQAEDWSDLKAMYRRGGRGWSGFGRNPGRW